MKTNHPNANRFYGRAGAGPRFFNPGNRFQRVWRAAAGALMLAGLVGIGHTGLSAPQGVGGKRAFDTMTVNLYVGGGIDRVIGLDPSDPNYLTRLVATVTGVYYEIVASQPPVRLEAVADQIVARMPDVVAVEEASLLRNQSPGDLVLGGTSPATNVVFDYLQLLTDALSARGAHYAVAVTSQEIDVEMPMKNLVAGTLDDARLTDREAILVRTDLPPGQLLASHPQSGNFVHIIQVPGSGLTIPRGWCSVDLFVRGEQFRYVCAHLEEETVPGLQVLQAQELLQGPVATPLPVVVCGDFNADPLGRDGSVAYGTLTGAGLADAWAVLHPLDPAGGLTWGHDEWLADPNTLFNRRIDLAFFRGADFVPANVEAVDLVLAGRTQPPLWATDHAALAAGFLIQHAAVAKGQ